MDITTLIVSLLPLLIAFAINFARKKEYKLHKLVQVYIYIFSLIVVLFFEISVRVAGGFKGYLELSLVNKNYFTYVLIGHIILSVLMLIIWSYTLFKAKTDRSKHSRNGYISFILIFLTSFSGIWVYLLLFVY